MCYSGFKKGKGGGAHGGADIFGAVLQVVVALLLRFLADVFEYGVELQQLSDETL